GARRCGLRFLDCQGSGTKGAINDVRNVRLWRALLGVDQRTVIEDIEFEEFEEEDAEGEALVVARVRPRSGVSRRCGRCGRRAPWYTGVRVGAGGGGWIGARCRWCWRPMRRG